MKRIFFKVALLLLLPGFVVAENKVAIFAGGCFWCLQADFDKLKGVVSTTVGYDGGVKKNPTYEQVSSGKTNYVESVKVVYDSNKINYKEVLAYYWRQIDPTVRNQQFCDKGKQYRSVIFYSDSQQKQEAELSKAQIQQRFNHVYTEILPSTHFYRAEEYHQKYYKKNSVKYKFYRWSCGRDRRLEEIWK